DVGQGDCALIQDGLTTVMIDTGGINGFDIAQECLIPYLRKRRIYHIDALIASHQDYDHVGGVSSLCAHYEVRKYVTDVSSFPLRVGNLTFTNHNDYGFEEENEKSLFLSLSFMGKVWLFTGDAGVTVEKNVIRDYPDLDCDVLKVGHHGSDTSTSEAFLDAVKPEVAVISCGKNNKFGHPKTSVVRSLSKRGITIRRTDEEGTITFWE
nr:MBL fold metallo-hydrolase [Bacilli bacterium]